MRARLQALLWELQDHRLSVALVPSRRPQEALRGAMIRVAVDQNPAWYRRFCARYSSTRVRRSVKADTRIRRANVTSVLARLAAGIGSPSPYARALIDLADQADPSYIPDLDDDPAPF